MVQQNRRILVIDDTPAIHEDFRRILGARAEAAELEELEELEAALFGDEMQDLPVPFELEGASQGEEGVAKVRERLEEGRPFALAFVDMRMPPGWDGVETVKRLWLEDPRLQVVICTAYSDCSWSALTTRLEMRDRLLILKKPFAAIEVYQLANALSTKWELSRQGELKMAALEEMVDARTVQLSAANKTLQVRSEELFAVNAALQARTDELSAANEALQARTEELSAANEALQAVSSDLALSNQALAIDMAQREAAELEARNAERRVSDIVEFLPDATFVVDQEKRVIAWNRAMEELTGVGKEEMLGKGDHAYAVPFFGTRRMLLIDMLDKERGVPESCYGDLKIKGETICAEVKLMLRGTERLLWSAAAPLHDLQGELVGGIQTIREITDLRRTEQERSRLEADLAQSNLLQSLIVKLNQDLRTPITPLFALLPVVRERTEDPALRRMLDVCEKSAEQILHLTAESTEWVRLSGKSRAELAPVILARVARERLQKAAGLFAQLEVSCSCSEIDSTLTVLGAPDQLALLFDNLLSNAARFARKKGTVCIWALSAAGMVTVAVQDDGKGLSPDECEHLFDEYLRPGTEGQRADAERLELALCKRIVLNHKGNIWAESPGPGHGTTIFLTLQEAR